MKSLSRLLLIFIMTGFVFVFIAAFVFAQAKSVNPAPQLTAQGAAKKSEIEKTHINNPAAELHKHEEEIKGESGENGEHITHEHGKLDLFHAEYYGMPWRNPQTQKYILQTAGLLVFVNLFFWLLFARKLKRKYGIGKK